MLRNARVTAFTVSELLKGAGKITLPPPTQIRVNIKLILIHYLCSEKVINFLLDILLDYIKYQQLSVML